MAYKINKITITNFKTFVGKPFELELNGKNLLLYGENGSGKSSIYWSIYTMLQSCLKKQDATEAGKYFDPANPENLRNRYSNETDDSSIKMDFIDDADSRTKGYTDSKDGTNTAKDGDMFMFDTLSPSDFINYQFLFSIFNFRNSQDADIFEIFERDIFPTLEFTESLYDVNNVKKPTQNARDWWNYLTIEALEEIERYQNGKFKPSGVKYGKHKELIDKFNKLLKVQVAKIEFNTNELLKPDGGFPLPLQIKLRVEPLKFNQQLRRGSRRRDEKITKPQIILTAELTDTAIPASNRALNHPHTFLNEAKLARIALAMRFAIVNMKNEGVAARGAQILCIDDMLISLDMSNRLEVIDYLLDTYSNDYQIIFMTHDKSLYKIMEYKIHSRNEKNRWKFKELYFVEKKVAEHNYPYSELVEVEDLLIVAKNHFWKHNYPACANTLRRKLEEQLHKILPENFQITEKGNGRNLYGLLNQLPLLTAQYHIPNLLPNFDLYREHIMNPLSHDDLRTNIYREEMRRCINDLTDFSHYTRIVIVSCEKRPELFKMDIACQSVEFEVSEVWDYIQDSTGKKYYKSVELEVTSSSLIGISPGSKRKVDALYKKMCVKIGLAEDARPDMISTIIHLSDGKSLASY